LQHRGELYYRWYWNPQWQRLIQCAGRKGAWCRPYNVRQNWFGSLWRYRKPFGLKTGRELCVCKPADAGATVNQN
jgi:hypothetical protein